MNIVIQQCALMVASAPTIYAWGLLRNIGNGYAVFEARISPSLGMWLNVHGPLDDFMKRVCVITLPDAYEVYSHRGIFVMQANPAWLNERALKEMGL